MSGSGLEAAPFCAPKEAFAQTLKKLKETRKGFGLTNQGLIEVFVSPDGNWSIIYTDPAGISCGLASGTAWEEINEKPDRPVH